MSNFKKYMSVIQESEVNMPENSKKIEVKMPKNFEEIEVKMPNFKISFRALVSKLNKKDDGPLTINCTVKKDDKEININNTDMPLLYTEFSSSKQLVESNMKSLNTKLKDYPELIELIKEYIKKIINNKEQVEIKKLEEGSILTFHKNEKDWTLSHPADEMETYH